MRDCDILLLDEPTNHLDSGIENSDFPLLEHFQPKDTGFRRLGYTLSYHNLPGPLHCSIFKHIVVHDSMI